MKWCDASTAQLRKQCDTQFRIGDLPKVCSPPYGVFGGTKRADGSCAPSFDSPDVS